MNQTVRVNFSPKLVSLVLSGEKNLTWRINDDKNIKIGDTLILWMKGLNKKGILLEDSSEFGRGKVVEVWEKAFKNFSEKEKKGHEKFSSDEEMINQYKKYYGDSVNSDTLVKIIRFELIKD